MRIQDLNKEIDECIKFLVDEGICHKFLNTHIENKSIVPCGGNPGFVKFSSFREYKNWVKEIENNNQFVIILFDGAIISFSYEFKDNAVIKQMRCLYLPNIYIYSQELLADVPDEEELELLTNTNETLFYHPLRFDYLNPDCVSEQRDDPYCHVHLGFLEESRLPINAPINPKIIIQFILENYYPKKFSNIKNKAFFTVSLSSTIKTNIRDKDKKRYYLKMD